MKLEKIQQSQQKLLIKVGEKEGEKGEEMAKEKFPRFWKIGQRIFCWISVKFQEMGEGMFGGMTTFLEWLKRRGGREGICWI